jgi:hypothetical protein
VSDTSQSVTLSNGRVLSVKTNHVRPPVPFRNCDWNAVDDRTYEGGDLIGWGETEQQAIDDLLEQICNEEDVCLPGCKWCAKEAARG